MPATIGPVTDDVREVEGRGVSGRGSSREAALSFALMALFACAPTQRVTLTCVPEEVTLYVDGSELEGLPETLMLRSDRPHTLYVKGPGYAPELVVLRSDEVSGKARLSPSEVCVKPRYVAVRRKLTLDVDQDVSAGPPGASPDASRSREAGSESTIDIEKRPDFLPSAP